MLKISSIVVCVPDAGVVAAAQYVSFLLVDGDTPHRPRVSRDDGSRLASRLTVDEPHLTVVETQRDESLTVSVDDATRVRPGEEGQGHRSRSE